LIPVDMTTKHEPPNSIGDCFPCCIASILELPRESVPHVYEGDGWTDTSGKVGMARLQAWLATLGLHYLEFELPSENYESWTAGFGAHYVVSGIGGRGVRHCTVGFQGKMVHDPHVDRTGVLPDDGKYSMGLICRA
jgi:hypothetical protein